MIFFTGLKNDFEKCLSLLNFTCFILGQLVDKLVIFFLWCVDCFKGYFLGQKVLISYDGH